MAFLEKMANNHKVENDELLETDPPENGTIETPLPEKDGGGRLVEKFVDGELIEATLYDDNNKIIQFIDRKRLEELMEHYSNILEMQGIDGNKATQLSNELLASLIPEIPSSVRNQMIKALNYQSFMSKSKK